MTAPRAPANRAEVEHIVASVIDHPSVYMGGPSWGSLRTAKAILAALEAAGVRLVPVALTDKMWRDAGEPLPDDDVDAMWTALVAASPYAPEGGR